MGKESFPLEGAYCKEDGFPLIQFENYFKCSRSVIDEHLGNRRLAALEYDKTANLIYLIFENGAILPVDMRAIGNIFYDKTFRESYGPTFIGDSVDQRLQEKEQTLQGITGRRIIGYKVMAGIDPSYSEEIFLLLDDNSTMRFITTQLHEDSLYIRTYEEDDPMVPAGLEILHEDRRYWDELSELEHEI